MKTTNFIHFSSSLMLFMTIMMASTFYITVGEFPTGQRLGIVSDELSSFQACNDISRTVNLLGNGSCEFSNLSCRFLNKISDKTNKKKYYRNYDDAYKSAKSGDLDAIIHFSSNFTYSMQVFINNVYTDVNQDDVLNGREIKVNLDGTAYLSYVHLHSLLYKTYDDFSMEVMRACNKSTNSDEIFITFETPIFGLNEIDLKQHMTPMAFLCLFFFALSVNTITNFIDDRKNGSWCRTFMSGVGVIEFVLAHSIVHIAIGLFQLSMALSLLFFCFPNILHTNVALVVLFFGLIGCCGLCFGILLGCYYESATQAMFAMNFVSFMLVCLPG